MTSSKSTTTTALVSLFCSGLLGAAPAFAAQASEHYKLLPEIGQAGDRFGSAVATDGTLVAVGSGSGTAFVFEALSGDQLLELVPSDGAPSFGASVAVDGARVAVGAPLADGAGSSTGSVYVFDSTTGDELFELGAADASDGAQFGMAVAMDGGLVVVGALDAAYLFDAATGQQVEKLVPDGGPPVGGTGIATIAGGFGQAVDIDSGRIVVGAKTANGSSLYSGAAYVFDTSGNELHTISAGPAWCQFGGSVGIDGSTVVVGAKYNAPNGKDSGQAYLFDALTGSLTESLVPSDGHIFAHFGSSVAVDGQYVAVGAEQDNGGSTDAGSVYLYDAQNGDLIVKLTAGDAAPGDDLGEVVDLAKGVVVAGAPGDDDDGSASGSAYLFDAAGTVTTMSECIGNAGTLDHVGGIPLAGQTLEFRLDDAQTGTSLALLAVSGAPAPSWPSCGIDLGSAGELLIDVGPPLLLSSALWTGPAAEFQVSVPPVSGLMGLHIYLQGALLAPTQEESVRLTNGLEVVLGGYL